MVRLLHGRSRPMRSLAAIGLFARTQIRVACGEFHDIDRECSPAIGVRGEHSFLHGQKRPHHRLLGRW
jgi:hypothetical protein